MAAAIMSQRISNISTPAITIDSGGTSAWHVGQGPNPQSQKAWEAAGYRYHHVASHFTKERLQNSDLVLAMDLDNFQKIRSLSEEPDIYQKIFLMREFDIAAEANSEVPDPYSLSDDAFVEVRIMLERSIDGLLSALNL